MKSEKKQSLASLRDLIDWTKERLALWAIVADEPTPEQIEKILKIFKPTGQDLALAQADGAIMELREILVKLEKLDAQRKEEG